MELHRLLDEDAAASPGSHLAARASELRPGLVFCGGYDERVVDCVCTARELDELARRSFPNSGATIAENAPGAATGTTLLPEDRYVYLVRNVSSLEKAYLLRNALALIYTPVEEHFGIVPVEAMRLGTYSYYATYQFLIDDIVLIKIYFQQFIHN